MQSSSPHSDEYPEQIAWSSSDTEQSDDENQEKKNAKAVSQQQRQPQRSGKATAPVQSYIRALSMLTAGKGEKRKPVLTHLSQGNYYVIYDAELFLNPHIFYFTFQFDLVETNTS